MYVSERGQVRLGLVVVEVADEVLDGVLGEELAELGVQLGGERLVVREDQRRLVVLGDRPGEGRGLAGAGGAEQCLVPDALGEAVGQPLDRRGLVAGGLEGGDELEVGHGVLRIRRSADVNKRSLCAQAPHRTRRRPSALVASSDPEVSMTRVAAGRTRSTNPACASMRRAASSGSVPRPARRSTLDLGSAGDEPDLVADRRQPAIEQPDGFDDDAGGAVRLGRLDRSHDPRPCRRSGDRLEVGQRRGIAEDDPTEPRPVERPILGQRLRTEPLDDGVERRRRPARRCRARRRPRRSRPRPAARRASRRRSTCRSRSAR